MHLLKIVVKNFHKEVSWLKYVLGLWSLEGSRQTLSLVKKIIKWKVSGFIVTYSSRKWSSKNYLSTLKIENEFLHCCSNFFMIKKQQIADDRFQNFLQCHQYSHSSMNLTRRDSCAEELLSVLPYFLLLLTVW